MGGGVDEWDIVVKSSYVVIITDFNIDHVFDDEIKSEWRVDITSLDPWNCEGELRR